MLRDQLAPILGATLNDRGSWQSARSPSTWRIGLLSIQISNGKVPRGVSAATGATKPCHTWSGGHSCNGCGSDCALGDHIVVCAICICGLRAAPLEPPDASRACRAGTTRAPVVEVVRSVPQPKRFCCSRSRSDIALHFYMSQLAYALKLITTHRTHPKMIPGAISYTHSYALAALATSLSASSSALRFGASGSMSTFGPYGTIRYGLICACE